jgi:hypothetical protein
MASPSSPPIAIPASAPQRVTGRRISTAALEDLEEPRPPGGWNTLERFATSYQRSATFFRIDPGSPGGSLQSHRGIHLGIPSFDDDTDTAVVDADEESPLMSRQSSTRELRGRHSSMRRGDSGDLEDHFSEFRRSGSPKPGDETYGTIRPSRRPSLLPEGGGHELLIKEVEDEAGNIIEVVVGQVMPLFVFR